MRKLLALLIVLPLLAGAYAGPVTPGTDSAPRTTTAPAAHGIEAVHAPSVQPPLAGLSAAAALPMPAPVDAARAPTRTSHAASDPLADDATRPARTRLAQRRGDYLAYARAMHRARANVPISYGTPPPASAT